MGVDDVPMDDKAKRMRDLLSSFYSPDPAMSSSNSSKLASLDAINTNSFDANQYMYLLAQKSNLEGLLQKHVEMAAEIKNLDTDLQMLVYENYNKFISATDTIKRMKNNIVGMETNMEQLLEKIMSVQSRSDGVNSSLFEKREHIEKLHRTRNLLRKVQFIYDLPARLGKCIKAEEYADAVRFYTGAMPIFKVYGDSSFQDCKRASEEAIATVIKNLSAKLFSDTESIQSRAEAAVLLKQLDFPVENLKAKLFVKLEQSLGELELKPEELTSGLEDSNGTPVENKSSAHEFAEAIRAYRVIFPDSEKQLIKLLHNLITKHFEVTEQYINKHVPVAKFLGVLRIIWRDVLLLDEALPEAFLPDYSLEAGKGVVKKYVASAFSNLLRDISDSLTIKAHMKQKEEAEEHPLQVALESSKNVVLKGSIGILVDFRLLLDDTLDLLLKLRDSVIHWVQEGFQDFFTSLDIRFVVLSGKNKSEGITEGIHVEKVSAGLVLVLAQLSIYIEQTVIPRITEEIASSFSSVVVQAGENGPALNPGELCRIFRTAGEKFLHHYMTMRTQRVSVLLRKRFKAPNWVKHKEPREVHMFVDLFLQEVRASFLFLLVSGNHSWDILDAIGNEVKQVLPQGVLRKHRRSESNGSSASSRSNTLREDKLTRSNTQRARSQLLETHLAKLFKQKVEIFTKTEFTQDSVVTTIVKLCLKSIQEIVRLQTFSRCGFQQIQLDIQFLRAPLKEIVEDEAAVDFLLDEVIVGTSERCLDPVPLEPPILDKLIQAKLAKKKEQDAVAS